MGIQQVDCSRHNNARATVLNPFEAGEPGRNGRKASAGRCWTRKLRDCSTGQVVCNDHLQCGQGSSTRSFTTVPALLKCCRGRIWIRAGSEAAAFSAR